MPPRAEKYYVARGGEGNARKRLSYHGNSIMADNRRGTAARCDGQNAARPWCIAAGLISGPRSIERRLRTRAKTGARLAFPCCFFWA